MKTWDQIARRLLWVAAAVLKAELRPTAPPRLVLQPEQVQTTMGVQFKYTTSLPTPSEPLSKAELTVTVNGTAQPATNPPTDGTAFTFGQFDANDAVSYSLVYVDMAGNPSTPTTDSFTVSDTVPPAAPGKLAFTVEQVTI